MRATNLGTTVQDRHPPGIARRFFSALGPGLVTGAADDDPSGVATYSIAGAQMGTALLWTAFITWPLMAAVQFMCARIGMATGRVSPTPWEGKLPAGFYLAEHSRYWQRTR